MRCEMGPWINIIDLLLYVQGIPDPDAFFGQQLPPTHNPASNGLIKEDIQDDMWNLLLEASLPYEIRSQDAGIMPRSALTRFCSMLDVLSV